MYSESPHYITKDVRLFINIGFLTYHWDPDTFRYNESRRYPAWIRGYRVADR